VGISYYFIAKSVLIIPLQRLTESVLIYGSYEVVKLGDLG